MSEVMPTMTFSTSRGQIVDVDIALDNGLHVLNLTALDQASLDGLKKRLVRVWLLLRSWSIDTEILNAGLFHALYIGNMMPGTDCSDPRRKELAAFIGERAERLVYLFSIIDRDAFLNRYLSFGNEQPLSLALNVPTRQGNVAGEAPSNQTEISRLLVLIIATQVSLPSRNPYVYEPGPWLNLIARVVHLLRTTFQLDLPVCRASTELEIPEVAVKFRTMYKQACAFLFSDPQIAEYLLKRCISICTEPAEPSVALAFVYASTGRSALARESALCALSIFDRWGVAWDKRLAFETWASAARQLSVCDGPAIVEATLLLSQLNEVQRPYPECAKETSSDSGDRFLKYISTIGREKSEAMLQCYPYIASLPFHDAAQFDVVRMLEENFDEIRREVLNLGDRWFHEEAERIDRSGSWQVLMLYEVGRRKEALNYCPVLDGIISESTSVRRQGGIYISKMTPNTHIAAHRGPTNVRLRAHLGIQVPSGDCKMRVGEQTTTWSEGKCIVFDDSFEHEVWNNTGVDRVVLLLDLWHPDLSHLERDALDAFFWYAQTQARGIAEYWERNQNKLQQTTKRISIEPV